MKLPSLFRRTPFRLTLLFLALFATAASAILAYVYVASAQEAQARAQAQVDVEADSLKAIYDARGVDALNVALIERISRGGSYLYFLTDKTGQKISANLDSSPIAAVPGATEGQWDTFRLTEVDAVGGATLATLAGTARVAVTAGTPTERTPS